MEISNALRYASADDKVIGFFFSASYCKWCKEFIPLLLSIYPHLRENNIEIVFVGSDKTEDVFNEYKADHPWPFIEYSDPIRAQLRVSYDIKTIPALVFIDNAGKLIEADGRNVLPTIMASAKSLQDATNTLNYMLSGSVAVSDEIEYDSDNSDF